MMDSGIKIDVNAVRLQHAVLCAGCDVISDSPHDSCRVCGSRSLLPLARILGNLPAVPAPAPQKPKQLPELPSRVLLLVPPVGHRRRQRVRPGV